MTGGNEELISENQFFSKLKKLVKKDAKFQLGKIFRCNDKLNKDQFVLNCFNVKPIIHYFDKLDKQLTKFMGGILKKSKIQIQNLPLDKIAKIQKAQVPQSISILCSILNKLIIKENFQIDKEIRSLEKQEVVFCESIANGINSGFIEEIDFTDVPFIMILNVLKVILKSLPENLFTEVVSRKLLSFKLDQVETDLLLKKALEKIPFHNYKTIICILQVVYKMLENASPKVFKSISSFFTSSFFITNSPNKTNKALFLLKYLFENAQHIFHGENPKENSRKNRKEKFKSLKLVSLNQFSLKVFKGSFYSTSNELLGQ